MRHSIGQTTRPVGGFVPAIPDLPHRSRGLSADVVAHLASLIGRGEFPPGARVPSERALADALAVSRTTVRQALAEMEARGMVTRHHGRGTIVAEPAEGADAVRGALAGAEGTWRDVADLEDILEPGIASRAARRATQASVRRLENLVAEAEAAGDPGASAAADAEFHLALAEGAANPLVSAAARGLAGASAAGVAPAHDTANGRAVALAGHRAILAAVRAGDGTGAAAAMARHLEEVRGVIRDDQRGSETRGR
nr:FCD domain-containing protein [Microbacterium sp. ZXX196]